MKNQNSSGAMLNTHKSRAKSSALLSSCIFITAHLVGCGGPKENKAEVTTLDVLIENIDHDCAASLLVVGNDLIGSKKSFLRLETLDEALAIYDVDNSDSEKTDSEKTNQVTISDVNDSKNTANKPLIVSGILEYNDRPAHVNFDAYLMDASNHKCAVKYQLDYHFTDPCMVIREEAFKKWNRVGLLGEHTRLYVHKRKPNRKAYLTDIERNVQCLVSVRGLHVL